MCRVFVCNTSRTTKYVRNYKIRPELQNIFFVKFDIARFSGICGHIVTVTYR
jgi:hypothetical protein